MEGILRLDKVKRREIIIANQVRKWLHIITLSDAANLEGTHIPANRFDCSWRHKSDLKWPNQPRPMKEMFQIFRKLVKRAFCSKSGQLRTQHSLPLDKALGAWLPVDRHCTFKFHRTSNTIFKRSGDNFERFVNMNDGTRFISDGYRASLPTEAHPIDCYEKDDNLFAHHPF